MDAAIVVLILRVTAHSWNSIASRYPASEPATDALRREFQSFRIGAINLGFSVHVIADESRLHLRPAWILRRLGGRPASIPWEEIRPLQPSPLGGRFARIAGKTITGPRWCIDLADPTGALHQADDQNDRDAESGASA
jgi:hypothetical protein